jgi:hypothetical protein
VNNFGLGHPRLPMGGQIAFAIYVVATIVAALVWWILHS